MKSVHIHDTLYDTTMGPFESLVSMLQLLQLQHAVFITTILFSARSTMVVLGVGVGETRVQASAPVNPVELNGIFSLRCDVAKPKPHQEITIFRTVAGTVTERLSVNEEVLDSAGERVYLAVRQMTDGTTVYLLSIMMVSREDEGVYVCKIFDMESQDWVSDDSVDLQVLYTPDSEPSCEVLDTYYVMEGSRVRFNCSSEAANPRVNLNWIQGAEKIPNSVAGFHDNRVYTTLTFIPTLDHQNVVFTCEVSSRVFPGYKQTCHVGPFQVYPNPNIAREPVTKEQPPFVISNGVVTKNDDNTKPKPGGNSNRPGGSDLPKDCRNLCTPYNYPVMYWIIGTIAACVSAIVFLIIGISLVVRYRRLDTKPKPTYYLSEHPTDDIYTELECRRGDPTVYMSLGKTQVPHHKGQLTLTTLKEDSRLYDIKPTN